MQIDFKKQVREWKTILLRGHDPQDFEKYRDLSVEQETLVQRNAKTLIGSLAASSAQQIAGRFLEAHQTLSRNYRAAGSARADSQNAFAYVVRISGSKSASR